MQTLAPTIRNTVRAVIIRNGHILLQKKQDALNGVRYTLPGGAQNPGETLLEALHRECQEELGTEIIAGEILHLADFFKQKSLTDSYLQHQLEILFHCQIADSYTSKNGPKPDKHQIAIEWIAINKLPQIPLLPAILKEILAKLNQAVHPIYLGKIN